MIVKEFIDSYLKTIRTKYDNKNDGTYYCGLISTDDRSILNDEMVDTFDEYIQFKGSMLSMYINGKFVFECSFEFIDYDVAILCLINDYNMPRMFLKTFLKRTENSWREGAFSGLITQSMIMEDPALLNKLLNTDFESMCKENELIYEELYQIPCTVYSSATNYRIEAITIFISAFELNEAFIDNTIMNFSERCPQCVAILLEYKNNNFKSKEEDIML
jgi:hypothetical protein